MTTNPRFAELLSKLLDDQIADHEVAELQSFAGADPSIRSQLIDHLLLDTLLEENLGQESLTALVDTISEQPFTPQMPTTLPAPSSIFRPWPLMPRWGWIAAAAVSIIVFFTFFFQSDRRAVASATQLVQAALHTHTAGIERIYVVEVKRGMTNDRLVELPRDVRVATQGDRFWVQMRGQREWTWGRNEQGAVWMTLGPRQAVVVSPDEIGLPLRYIGDLYTLNLETLLKSFLKHCSLELKAGPADSMIIVATPNRQWSSRPLKQATIEVDRETKAIRKLVIEREFERSTSVSTFTLVDSRVADESRYSPEGHLSEPYRISNIETTTARRREIITNWFGPMSEQWIQQQKKSASE